MYLISSHVYSHIWLTHVFVFVPVDQLDIFDCTILSFVCCFPPLIIIIIIKDNNKKSSKQSSSSSSFGFIHSITDMPLCIIWIEGTNTHTNTNQLHHIARWISDLKYIYLYKTRLIYIYHNSPIIHLLNRLHVEVEFDAYTIESLFPRHMSRMSSGLFHPYLGWNFFAAIFLCVSVSSSIVNWHLPCQRSINTNRKVKDEWFPFQLWIAPFGVLLMIDDFIGFLFHLLIDFFSCIISRLLVA